MYFSPLVNTPISLALETTLENVPTDVTKSIDDNILKIIKHHREDSCFSGNKLWDEYFTDHVATELWHFQLKKNIFSMQLT